MDSAAPKAAGLYRPHVVLRLLAWFAIYISCVAAMYVCMPEYNAPWHEMALWPFVGLENLTTHMLQPYIPDETMRKVAVILALAFYPLHLTCILILRNQNLYRFLMSFLITMMALSFFGAVFVSGWGDMMRNHGFHTVSPHSPIPGTNDDGHYDR